MSEQIERRHARSETVDYSAPIEIHDSSQLRIELVPFYIGTNFAAKIIRYDKRKGWEQTAISTKIVDLSENRFTFDARQREKRPDWTYGF